MSSVDDRIVNMKFNNSQFGQGVDKSKRDLTGLEKTIANAGKSKGMTQLAGATEGVRVKFSALQVAGTAALATIAAKATTAGLNLVKSLTIAPIMDGFREYQTGLTSVQTIMANTGKSVKVVNKYLDELNEFSDQTIYNFGEMAKNIGTFTAAGVELQTATSAIKGISNLAALSGSTSQQASTAMYQLSQAISAGRVNLQDWNSVVNAGMAGKQFKTALARTAVAMGGLSAEAVKVGTDVEIMGQSFRNSISAAAGGESWLNSDVLVKTLATLDGRFSKTKLQIEGMNSKQEINNALNKERIALAKEGVVYSDKEFKALTKMADAAFSSATTIKTFPQLMDVVRESFGSMWAGAFEIILGNFKESKKLWTSVGEVITGPSGIISNISKSFLGALGDWKEDGGRDRILKGFVRLGKGIKRVSGAIKDAFQDVFPPGAGSVLSDISTGFKRLMLIFKPGEETVESLRSIFGGFFAILHIGAVIFRGVMSAAGNFFKALFKGSGDARGGILSLFGSVGEAIKAFDAWLTQGGKLHNFLSGIGTVAGAFLRPVLSAIGLIIDGFASLISGEGLGGAMDAFSEAGSIFKTFFSDIIRGLDELTAPFDGLKSQIADVARWAMQPFEGFIDGMERARIQVVQGLGLDTVMPTMEGLRTLADRAKNGILDFANNFSIAKLPLEDFGDAIDYVVEKVQALVERLDISSKIESIKDSVSGLYESLTGGGGSDAASGSAAIASGAEATGEAFSKLGDIMAVIGGAVKKMFTLLGAAAGAIGGFIKDMFPSDALEWASLLNVLLTGAIIKKLFFSKGVFDELADAINGISDAMVDSFGQLTKTLKTMQNAVRAEMIKNIAIAVALLVASLVALSFIPMENLKTGLAALAGTFAILALMLTALSVIDSKMKIAVVAAGIVLLAGAIVLLTAAVAMLGFLPLDVLQQGLAGLALVMGILTVTLMALSGNSAKILAAGGAMVLMAVAVNTLVAAIAILGVLPMDTLQQGLAGVAAGIAIMVVALLALSGNSAKILAAGAAMVLMATALDILVLAITTLGVLPWSVVEQGLKAVAIGLGIMTLALLALSAVGPKALAAGAAMVLMAVSLNMLMSVILVLGAAPWDVVKQGLMAMGIALGILLVAAGLAMLVIPGLTALSSVILAIGAAMFLAGTGMGLFAAGLALLAGVGVAAIAVIVLAIHAFIALLPTIALHVAAAFVSFLQALALAAPKIRKAMGTIIKEMIGTIKDAVPEIGDLFDTLIDTALESIEEAVPRFAEAGLTIIDEFLKSVDRHVPSIVDSATSIIEYFVSELGNKAVQLANAGLDMLVDVMNGLSDAIENSDRVREAARNLARTFVDELRETLADLIPNIPMPDIPMPKIPSGLKRLLGGSGDGAGDGDQGQPLDIQYQGDKKSKAEKERAIEIRALTKALSNTAITVNSAIEGSVRLLVNALDGAAYNFGKAASALQYRAAYQAQSASGRSEAAEIASTAADAQLAKAENMKGKAKKGNKKGKALKAARTAVRQAAKQQKVADRMAEQAAETQMRADLEAQKARDEVMYNNADWSGKGDIRSQQGQDLAERSNLLLAESQAKADEAARLERLAAKGGKAADKYRKEAARLRKEAAAETAESMLLAKQAIDAQAQAVDAYAKARADVARGVIDRMSEIYKQQADEKEARAWEKEYQAADDKTKIAMLNARAAANDKKAAEAQDALNAAYAVSDAVNAEIAAGQTVSEARLAEVEKALTEAEKAAQVVSSAVDAADSDREAVKQLEEQMKQKEAQDNASGGGSSGGGFMPSRTALEDAALAVDRYTSSVAQAQEMARTASTTVQYVQNNYSPEALPVSEIYRQGRNLISMQEVKMGAN